MQHTSSQIFQLLDQKSKYKKSSVDMTNIVHQLFSNPNTLIDRINELSLLPTMNKSKDFNIVEIRKIYQNVFNLGLSKEIAKSFTEIAQRFQQPGKLSQFVKGKKQMKFFFIAILWDQLFLNPENRLGLFKILNLINSCPGYTSVMDNWAKQLDQQYLTKILDRLHVYLQGQCEKLPTQNIQGQVMQLMIKSLWLNISNISKFIGILYRSGLQNPSIPSQIFIFPSLQKYFSPMSQYKLHYNKIKPMVMLQFPYLMTLDYKYQLIKIESILQQKLNMQKSLSTGISSMINLMTQNGGFSLQGLIYLYIEVNRHNILDDSMQKLGKVKGNLKSPLRISFVGQEGADQGGVKNQYFQLITKQIFNPYLDMFLPKHNGRVYWFNGFSYQPPIRFEFVGMLLGLSIYNSVHLNIPLPNFLYKKLLSKQQQDDFSLELLNDLHDVEPDICDGLKKILKEQGSLDDLQLYFTIQLQNFGQIVVQDLTQDGRQIKVTQDNKVQYCQLYADYLLNKHPKKQFQAFKKGFYKVVSGKMIQLFDPIDLKTIIYGNDVIDFKQLQQSTIYQGGYDVNTPVIQSLWEILHNLDIENKKAFLIFVTGSDRVPIEGMKSLNFVIQRHSNTSNLPSSHTCFNVFLLPDYETKQKLQKNIHIILKNNQGFGLI